MKTFDNESFQIEYLENVPSSRVIFYGNYLKCKSILHKIKKYKKWINSSGKDDSPPDFYSNKYHLMMDAMAINDVEYIKNNKVINEQKKRQHILLQNYLGRDYRKIRDDITVYYNYDLSRDKHSYENYKSSFKRIIEKHKDSIPLYKKNHHEYKLVFYLFDESVEYSEYKDGKSIIHVCFNDRFFMDIIKKLDVDFVVWLSHVKYVEKNNKEIKIPRAAVYEVKNLYKYRFIDYSSYDLKPVKWLEWYYAIYI